MDKITEKFLKTKNSHNLFTSILLGSFIENKQTLLKKILAKKCHTLFKNSRNLVINPFLGSFIVTMKTLLKNLCNQMPYAVCQNLVNFTYCVH